LKRIILLDPEILDVLEDHRSPNPDPVLLSRVNEALEQLAPEYRELLRMRYYDGVPLRDIASALDKSDKEVKGLLYEAKRQMKILLAGFVRKRWGVETEGICGICSHAQRNIIEKILSNKVSGESWRKINDRIFKAIGERFQPPQILKAHIKHMDQKRGGQNERR
jgi:hypothetical protein